jgi:hypothetical protein
MPRITVTAESSSEREITLDEQVTPSGLEPRAHSHQLIERIGWAVHDAAEAEDRSDPADAGRSDEPHISSGTDEPSPLSKLASAVRDHESETRRSVSPASNADRSLYRRLRLALDRR